MTQSGHSVAFQGLALNPCLATPSNGKNKPVRWLVVGLGGGETERRRIMSKMRMSILAALAAIGVGLGGASSASAAPANGNAIGQIDPTPAIQKVYYYRHYRHYRHCWWRNGYRICR